MLTSDNLPIMFFIHILYPAKCTNKVVDLAGYNTYLTKLKFDLFYIYIAISPSFSWEIQCVLSV